MAKRSKINYLPMLWKRKEWSIRTYLDYLYKKALKYYTTHTDRTAEKSRCVDFRIQYQKLKPESYSKTFNFSKLHNTNLCI